MTPGNRSLVELRRQTNEANFSRDAMRQALRRFLAERFQRAAVIRGVSLFLSGACAAACVLAVWLQGVTWLGTTLPVSTGMTLSLVFGFVLGLHPRMARLWERGAAATLYSGCLFTLAAWTVITPWLISGLNGLVERGLIRADAPLANVAVSSLITLPLLTIPAFVAAWLCQGLCRNRIAFDRSSKTPRVSSETSAISFVLCGSISGLIALATFAAFGSLLHAVWGFGLVCAGLAFVALWRFSDLPTAASSPAMEPEARGVTLIALLVPFITGVLLAATTRILDQLSPVSVFTLIGEWVAVLIGCVIGVWGIGFVRQGKVANVRTVALLISAVVVTLVPALFPTLIRAYLWINSHVSQPWLSLICRGGLTAAFLSPLFAAWSCWACTRHSAAAGVVNVSGNNADCWSIRSLPVALTALGFLLASVAFVFQLNPATAAVVCGSLLCGAGLANIVLTRLKQIHLTQTTAVGANSTDKTTAAVSRRLPIWRGAGIAAVLGCIALGTCLTANYEPARSAKTLFATNAFLAYRGGYPENLLPYLDQGRLMNTTISERGVVTLWKYGANQFQLRENGIPKGTLSTDPEVFPQYVPDLFQAAVPLVLHEHPERVLVLGLCSGMPVTTALQFPVQQVVCLEGEQGLVTLLRQRVFPACQLNPLDDERTTIRVVEPVLGLAAEAEPFDVIISAVDQGALIRSQASFTHEFYRRAAAHMRTNGIFCQRFQYVDVGPEAIRQIAKTLGSAFSSVTALEVGPGELLFLATNDERGVVREKLLDRLQAAQVRNACSHLGMDWSVVLNLPAFGPEGLASFGSESAAPVNRAAGGSFAFYMPREVLRWAPKNQEVHAATVQRIGRFLDWLSPEEATSKPLVRRLAEVAAQRELVVKHSTQYWAYRASLRDQVQNHSRSMIEQASATDEQKKLHPEDRRRIRYFKALKVAIDSRSLNDVQKLIAFKAPYDPLVSFFVHQEAAELLTGSSQPVHAEEFRLRLHSVYFASPQDRSIRNVLQALKLLREHPEIEVDAEKRWDHFNSLLQMLQGRWESRIGVPSTESSQVVLGEVNSSILEAEKCIDVLSKLTVEAGLSAEMWTARKRVLELRLLRPLQEYHQEIFRHHQQVLQKQKAQADAMEKMVAPPVP